jgi:lipoprotein-releasing system permease protein
VRRQWFLPGWIAWRFSRGDKRQRFASFVSGFSTIGITLGVMALITVSSVMNGFEGQLKQRILNLVPHIEIPQGVAIPEPLQRFPVAPLVSSQIVIQSEDALQAAYLQGIDLTLQPDLEVIEDHLPEGDIDSLTPGSYRVVLGSGIAKQLSVRVGDTVRLMATDRLVYSPLGELPSQRNFTVAGIYEFLAEVDNQFVMVNQVDAARLLRSPLEQVQRQRLFLDDPFEIEALAPLLPEGSQDWRSLYGELFSAVKMEKNMMGLLFCLIIAVAAFNILSALVMMVNDKRSDIAILQTLGLSRAQLLRIFVLQGGWAGCLGALVGAASGVFLALHINGLLNVMGLNLVGGSGLPALINGSSVLVITLAAMVLSILASLYPAWQASRILPAEALRYE